MRRRQFLRNTALFGVPFALKGIPVAALPYFGPLGGLEEENDRVLVLVQLIGGNDGLNTFIPLDQYRNLNKHRGDILIPENKILSLESKMGLHPVMQGIKTTYQKDQISIVQDVGYPNQNRSHFRSTDIWSTGSASEEVLNSGWLGRYFDEQAPGFPEGYPNDAQTDPFAVAVGRTVAATCQGTVTNFSLAVNDPFSLSPIVTGEEGSLPDNYYGTQLKFLRNAIDQTNAYGEVIKMAAEKGTSVSTLYPEERANRLADQLKTVVKLISGGLKTKVYIVQLGGFDTHGNQVEGNDVTSGKHAELLGYLSQAIAAFQDDLNQLGLEKRVVGMTFSEFGRRIRSNGSLGTDHGTAAPLMLFGNCVRPGVIGVNPDIPDEAGIKDGVPMQYDFRNVYGSVLQDWFGLEQEQIQQLLFADYEYMPLLQNCSLATSTANYYLEQTIKLYPQPARTEVLLEFSVESANKGTARIMDMYGRVLKVFRLNNLSKGPNQLRLPLEDLPKGAYVLQLQLGSAEVSRQFIKI